MKTKSFLAILAIGCLCSCQQNEEFDSSKKSDAISFTMNSDGLKMDGTTRAMINEGLLKTSFVSGDVLSLGTSDSFSRYILGQSIYSWANFNATGVTFCAHYPELSSYQLINKRYFIGGNEYLFGTSANDITPAVKNVNLSFKRMSIPVVLVDSKGAPYAGNAKITLHLKNHGVQNLETGAVSVDPLNDTFANIEVNKQSEGRITNIIPQAVESDDVFMTLSINGQNYDLALPNDAAFVSGETKAIVIALPAMTRGINNRYNVIVSADDGYYNIGIIEGDIPLRR